MRLWLVTLSFPLVSTACGPTLNEELIALEPPFRAEPLLAFGILNFLNDAGTTLAVLDHDVPLNVRTARNLIAHRDGPDGAFGTADDDPFDGLPEVDAVSWVGPSALAALESFVVAGGLVPDADDLWGEIEGVQLTYGTAVAVLDLVNTAEAATLDDDARLDVRGVNSILGARPIASLAELAGLYYVGSAALQRLIDFVAGDPFEAPGVAFDENGLYDFLINSETPWVPERSVTSGFFSHDGTSVVLTAVQVPDDPDDWQQITGSVFDRLWACCFNYQYFGEPLEVGYNRRGTLHLGRVINAHDNRPYILAYWRDIDDASFGWIYQRDAAGRWEQAGEVFLN